MRGEHTPAWDSGNSTIWKEYIDFPFVANCLILSATSAVGIAANIFVILAVYHQKSLQTSNNALVVNLAVIDLLRCAIDCPILLTIVATVRQRGHVDGWLCDAQVASFSFSCCIQMLTLAGISGERYQAIAQPFKTSHRRRRIMVLITITWTLSILVSGFCLTFVKDSPVYVKCEGLARGESPSYDTFGIYILFPLWAVCFGVITGFYTRIFGLVRSHNRKIFDKGIFPLTKTDKMEEKQKKEEHRTTVGENGHEKTEHGQTLSKSVAWVELVTQAEPDSSKKESTAAVLTSAKAPQCVSISPGNKKELKKALEISDLEKEQAHPPVMQVAADSGGKPLTAEQSKPCSTKAQEKPSNRDAVTGVKSSTAKPQKVSSNFDTEKQPKERARSDTTAPSEMKEPRPHVPQPAQLESPESASILLIEPKGAKSSNTEETLAVAAAVDQASPLPPPLSMIVPVTEAKEEGAQVEGAVCMMPSKQSKERAHKKKESKMAMRAGYIIITFLLFWLPLIMTILVNFVLDQNKNIQITIVPDLEVLSVSVACITSLSNPIIYAVVNPQFREEFYRFKKRFKSIFKKKL